jgi:NitT/TauT family transport system substrate-binding protein
MSKVFSWSRWIVLSVVALVLTIACTQKPNVTAPVSSSSPATTSAPLVSATVDWIGYAGYYVALKKGFFAQAGLNIKDSYFKSLSDEVTALLAKQVDIAWMTSGDAIQAATQDPSLKIIYLVDYSNGADGILGRNITKPQDVKGKVLARENILAAKVLLQAYLKQSKLTESDLKIKDLDSAAAATAFASKQVDLAVTFEPFLTKSAQQGGGKVIFSSKDTNLIADVLVVRSKLLQTRKQDLQAYLRAVDKSVKLVNAGDLEALKMVGEKMAGVSVAEVKEQLTGVKIFGLAENKTVAFEKSNPNSLIGNLNLTAKTAVDFKIVSKPIAIESLYDDSIVKSM